MHAPRDLPRNPMLWTVAGTRNLPCWQGICRLLQLVTKRSTRNNCAAFDVRDCEVLTATFHMQTYPCQRRGQKVKGNTQTIRKCLLNLTKSSSVRNTLYLRTCTCLKIDIHDTPYKSPKELHPPSCFSESKRFICGISPQSKWNNCDTVVHIRALHFQEGKTD